MEKDRAVIGLFRKLLSLLLLLCYLSHAMINYGTRERRKLRREDSTGANNYLGFRLQYTRPPPVPVRLLVILFHFICRDQLTN